MATETELTPKTMLEQRFLDHIYDGYKAGQRYCFVLGAGASKSSDIRTGEEMMREWREYLCEKGPDYIQDCAKELRLQEKDYCPLFEDDYVLNNDDYFTLFDLRFAGEPNVAYTYLEKEMEGKYPSYGYFPLAMLLSNTENRLVITTNFDTLLEDALYTYTFKHPLVVGHESLASYIGSDARRPVIAKIHRDLLFRPFNRKEDMDKLQSEWEQPLCNALSRYIPIVIGYAGGDHTFMSLLQEIKLNGIYWCYLGDTPPKKITDIVAQHNGYLVKILGFDELMFQLGDRFAKEAEFRDPCQYMREQAETRCDIYQQNLDKIKEKYKTHKSSSEDTSGDGDGSGDVFGLINAIERYDDRKSDREQKADDISRLESEARKKLLCGDNDSALKLYTQLIALKPKDAKYYERRSVVLYKMKRLNEAVQDDIKAIELEPDNAEYYYSHAVTLHAMEEYDQALQNKTKAIELAPDNARYYYSRAITLQAMEQYEQALQDEIEAINLDPDNAKYYHSRAVTLHAMERYEQALQDRTKAIELDSTNALYYQQRGITLHAMEQYEQALQDNTKAIKLDPSNATYYIDRAITLRKLGRDEDAQQDELMAKRLSAKSDNA